MVFEYFFQDTADQEEDEDTSHLVREDQIIFEKYHMAFVLRSRQPLSADVSSDVHAPAMGIDIRSDVSSSFIVDISFVKNFVVMFVLVLLHLIVRPLDPEQSPPSNIIARIAPTRCRSDPADNTLSHVRP